MLEGDYVDDGSADAFDADHDAEEDYESTADTQAEVSKWSVAKGCDMARTLDNETDVLVG